MMYRVAVAVALLLAGCASGEVVELRRADGMVARCGPYNGAGIGPVADLASSVRLRDCVEDYQRAGYERAAMR